MSSSLVRKALEIVETESASSAQAWKKAKKNATRKDRRVQKVLKKSDRSRVLGDVKSEAARQIELARKASSKNKDQTTENLKKLMFLSKTKPVNFSRAEKILDQTVKRRKPLDDTVPGKSSSAFSEEDFKKFEEEYFVSN